MAQTPNTVGGHIGLAFPLVTTTGSNTTTIADVLTIAVPVGISIKGPGRMLSIWNWRPPSRTPREMFL